MSIYLKERSTVLFFKSINIEITMSRGSDKIDVKYLKDFKSILMISFFLFYPCNFDQTCLHFTNNNWDGSDQHMHYNNIYNFNFMIYFSVLVKNLDIYFQ